MTGPTATTPLAGKPVAGRAIAVNRPVARLMADVPLAHLDRPFDYLVPAEFDDSVQAGSRVRVRFAGRLVDGFVLERRDESEHEGRLAHIERVVGTEPVLTVATTRLFRAVADRWGGNFVDVVRLGVPPRHARAETSSSPGADRPPPPDAAAWSRYPAGASFLAALGQRRAARAVWSARPDEDWPTRLAEAMTRALSCGAGALAVVPDARDLARLDAALTTVLGPGQHVTLAADLGPAERYRRWLRVRRGAARAVIGTRSAAFAPVAELGLVAVWDDGDDLHSEPRAPYPNVRDVLVLRSTQEGCALLVGGFARTAESQLLLDAGWAHEVVAARSTVRAAAARVVAAGDDLEQQRDPAARAARLPSLALRTAREALAAGRSVLVQVPRGGYAPSLACARDRTPARCAVCHGPLAAGSASGVPACRWCGRPNAAWTCPMCGSRALRASIVGSMRTAEELGRAFPGTSVRTSAGAGILATVPPFGQLIVATPGAEPVCEGGYGAALLLDGWALLARPDLRAGEEALRRWLNAAALVAADGRIVINADATVSAVQALVRWDPAGFARREVAERAELAFPPVTRIAELRGTATAVAELVAACSLPPTTERIGPVEVRRTGREVGRGGPLNRDDPMGRGDPDSGGRGESESGGIEYRLLLRVARADGAALAHALHTGAAARSVRKAADPVRITLDPAIVG